MFNIKEIGKRIQKERKNSKFKSLDELAEEIGTTRQTLSKWEKGDGSSSPSLWDVERLCKIFGCDFGYLVGEYNCRTRINTDIQTETGLSESAVEKIITLSSQELRFIDDLLKNSEYLFSVSQSYCQYRDVGKIGLASLDGNVHIKHLNKPEWILPSNEVVNILKYAFSYEVLRFADRKQEDE